MITHASDHIANSERAIKRGLDFIYGVAHTPEGFDSYGSLSVCCFALVGATSRDPNLRQLSRSRAQKLARRWRRLHPVVPPDAATDLVFDCVMVSYALERLGLKDAALKEQIHAAAKQFSAQDLLGFDPVSEPPAGDLPHQCDCGFQNQRGRRSCKHCKKRLEFQSRYRVWMEALSNTYVGERCGVMFGAPYLDVLKWLPRMQPYPVDGQPEVEILREAIYAVTHIVYTLNDYSTYRLRPEWLPHEFAFLQANVDSAIERNDPEVLGELLDTLKAFGLRDTHPLVRSGTKFLLAKQNPDGSWGEANESIRTRCHTTWTAVDGLRKHAWRGLDSMPQALDILRRRRSLISAQSCAG